MEWSDFEKILQEEARYFSQEGTKLLTSVFKDIGGYSERLDQAIPCALKRRIV